MTMPTSEELLTALREVIDPELGYNIVDLGLIYEVLVDEGRASIIMTTTTPGCPATDVLQEGVRGCAGLVPGISGVDVRMVWDPPWTPERMSAEAKRHFGF